MSVPSFATIADMEARNDREVLVQLTDQAGVGEIDNARLNQALDRASNQVLSYIAAKYDVAAGLAETALDLLRDLTCDLALYFLYRETPPDGVKDRFKFANAELAKLQAGTSKLDTGSHEAAARPEGVLVSAPERMFGRDKMSGF